MVSAMKAPGGMALSDIQADIDARRYSVAKAKIDALVTTWQRFSAGPDSCSGQGIGDIMVTFSRIPVVEPEHAADGSQPFDHLQFLCQRRLPPTADARR
jgi:hypothetical protein